MWLHHTSKRPRPMLGWDSGEMRLSSAIDTFIAHRQDQDGGAERANHALFLSGQGEPTRAPSGDSPPSLTTPLIARRIGGSHSN